MQIRGFVRGVRIEKFENEIVPNTETKEVLLYIFYFTQFRAIDSGTRVHVRIKHANRNIEGNRACVIENTSCFPLR